MNNLAQTAIFADKLQNAAHKLVNTIDKTVASMIDNDDPTMQNPVIYKVSHRGGSLVRSGYETTTSEVDQLDYGKSVTVVEIRGRRARIIAPVHGWVSLKTANGIKILEPETIQYSGFGGTFGEDNRNAEKAFAEKFKIAKHKNKSKLIAKEAALQRQREAVENQAISFCDTSGGASSGFENFESSIGGFADFGVSGGTSGQSVGGGEIDLLDCGGDEVSSNTAAPLSFPKLAAPGSAPIAAPVKKKSDPFSSGGGDLSSFSFAAPSTTTSVGGSGGTSGGGDLLDMVGGEVETASATTMVSGDDLLLGGNSFGFDAPVSAASGGCPAPASTGFSIGDVGSLDLLGSPPKSGLAAPPPSLNAPPSTSGFCASANDGFDFGAPSSGFGAAPSGFSAFPSAGGFPAAAASTGFDSLGSIAPAQNSYSCRNGTSRDSEPVAGMGNNTAFGAAASATGGFDTFSGFGTGMSLQTSAPATGQIVLTDKKKEEDAKAAEEEKKKMCDIDIDFFA